MQERAEARLAAAAPLTVSQIVRMVREALEFQFDACWIVGEVSNARQSTQGHVYFTLKDPGAALSVVMFRSAASRLRFQIADGAELLVYGRVGLFESRGALQFYADEAEPRGLGALQLAFEQLKRRLEAEGLFVQERKRPIPFMPRTVGIVTASGGAGLGDMLRVMLERFPGLHVLIRPARVQGSGAGAEIAEAIGDLNRDGRAEVIVVGRGGGSLEDLWPFNEEVVARAIYRSAIPVVSAVGHEVDYTIADFVADVRAPTPTAAAHLVVPRLSDLQQELADNAARLRGAGTRSLGAGRYQLGLLSARLKPPASLMRELRQRLDDAGLRLERTTAAGLGDRVRTVAALRARLRPPLDAIASARERSARLTLRLAHAMQLRTSSLKSVMGRLLAQLIERAARTVAAPRRPRVDALAQRLTASAQGNLVKQRSVFTGLAAALESLSPLRVLERGYAVVLREGTAVTDASAVAPGEDLEIRLRRGKLFARTTGREV